MTRREFLKRSAATAAAAAVAPHLKLIPGTNVAWAAGPSDAIVIFIQMFGGNDGINMVYPLDDGFGSQRTLYEQYRPTLQLPNVSGGSINDPLSMASFENLGVVPPGTGPLTLGVDSAGNENALHPAMYSLWDLYQNQNNVAVIHGVHYPHPNHSHFRSEEIWHTGDPIGTGGLGWFGRYMNVSGFTPTEVPAVIIDDAISPLFKPSDASIFAFKRLSDLEFPSPDALNSSEVAVLQDAIRNIYNETAGKNSSLLPELVKIGSTGVATIDKMQEYYLPGNTPGGTLDNAGRVEALLLNSDGRYSRNNELVYDSPLNASDNPSVTNIRFMRDLRHVAATIRADVGARFFHVGFGGFDSHSNQEQGYYHSGLLRQVAESMAQLYNELAQSVSLASEYSGQGYLTGSLADKVVIVTISEFGRTIRQNAQGFNSAGTDHASAAPQLVIGHPSVVNGGQYGFGSLLGDPRSTNKDDLKMQHDFRDLYGTIAERWLGVPNVSVQPGGGIFEGTYAVDSDGNDWTAYTPIPFLNP
jgi:uncharacterized protein (DUF1501 family)